MRKTHFTSAILLLCVLAGCNGTPPPSPVPTPAPATPAVDDEFKIKKTKTKTDDGWVIKTTETAEDFYSDASYVGKEEKITPPDNCEKFGRLEVITLSDSVKEIHIPEGILFGAVDSKNLSKITVDENHKEYAAVDGVLYKRKPTEKKLYRLEYYPIEKKQIS